MAKDSSDTPCPAPHPNAQPEPIDFPVYSDEDRHADHERLMRDTHHYRNLTTAEQSTVLAHFRASAFAAQLGRAPSKKDIAHAAGITQDTVNRHLKLDHVIRAVREAMQLVSSDGADICCHIFRLAAEKLMQKVAQTPAAELKLTTTELRLINDGIQIRNHQLNNELFHGPPTVSAPLPLSDPTTDAKRAKGAEPRTHKQNAAPDARKPPTPPHLTHTPTMADNLCITAEGAKRPIYNNSKSISSDTPQLSAKQALITEPQQHNTHARHENHSARGTYTPITETPHKQEDIEEVMGRLGQPQPPAHVRGWLKSIHGPEHKPEGNGEIVHTDKTEDTQANVSENSPDQGQNKSVPKLF